jgi:hypothetical protein
MLEINRPKQPPAKAPTQMHRRLWLAAKVAALFVAGVFGFVASIYQIEGGPPWPTAPSFSPGPPSFGAAFDVPFRVENKSALVSIRGLQIKCKVEGTIPDQPTITKLTFGPNFVGASGSNTIAPVTSAPYTCPLRGAFVFGADATDIIRHARVTFIAEYDAHFIGARIAAEDGPFTWNETTVPPHWERGIPLK